MNREGVKPMRCVIWVDIKFIDKWVIASLDPLSCPHSSMRIGILFSKNDHLVLNSDPTVSTATI